jgi:hypothetical protein
MLKEPKPRIFHPLAAGEGFTNAVKNTIDNQFGLFFVQGSRLLDKKFTKFTFGHGAVHLLVSILSR